jgi:hypothetical protein
VDGYEFTMTAASRNSAAYQRFLQTVEDAHPGGKIVVVTDNLSSHHSVATRTWLEDHPQITQVFIPVGAAWLNLQEGWWRIYDQGRPGRAVLRPPSRDRSRHHRGHRPAQRSCQALDVGTTSTPAPPAPPEVHLPPLGERSTRSAAEPAG